MSTTVKTGINLFPHNQAAYEAAVSMLAETGKAAIIHPTGTGKSFIGFKFAEDYPEAVVCWLSPSEYIFKTQIENLIATGASAPANVVFFTYAKLMLMSEDELSEIKPDIVILDEFHRVGAEKWNLGVQKLLKMYSNVSILGLSATAIRYLDNQRDMSDELFEGNIASEMTLGEAIVRGILAAPKYVMSVYSYQNDLELYRNRIKRAQNKAVRDKAEKCLEAMRRAIEKADGLDDIFNKHMVERNGKYIVFTANYTAMLECMDKVKEWFAKVDKHPRIYSVYSADPTASESFIRFKEDNDSTHLRLLFAIDALNEGVHVDNISGVILFRPTVSPIIYKQQIGRALSASKKSEPVIFDIVNNFDNLYNIGALKEEMRAAITYYRYFGEKNMIINENFRIIDEVRDCRELFNELEETLTASWDLMFSYAKSYFNKYKNLDVPKRYKTEEGYSLGIWLNTQRAVRSGKAEGFLDETRIAKLDEIGMRWDSVNDVSWETHYKACKKYVEQHGNLQVPSDYVTINGLMLGRWVIAIRKYYKSNIRSNYFTPERKAMLDSLGMIWDQPDYLWEQNFSAALAYHEKNGNLDVPSGYVQDGVKLYNWLADLRKMYRNAPGRRGTLTDAQIERLNELGMRWKSQKELVWDKGFNEAQTYYTEYGTFDTPFAYVSPSGFKLGIWASKCREKYVKGTLSSEQIEQLESINIVWSKSRKNDWDECFAHVKSYYEEHGNLSIPANCVVDGIWLNKWLNEQKHILLGKRKGKLLTEVQIDKLNSLSPTKEGLLDYKWEKNYEELRSYYNKYGNIKVPVQYKTPTGQSLYLWLSNQKAYYKTGKMNSHRIELLSQIGFNA